MGAEIDRLEVQIESKATKANNSLDNLVTKLEKVSSALSRLNSSGLSSLSDGVTKFAQASTQLSNVKTADFTRMARNIDKLSNLNSQKLYGASHAMRTLANSMNSFGNVSASSAGIAEFASSISKLGGVNVQRAITNLPALAIAMNNLMFTLSRAPQVSRNIIDMTNALANLASQGSRVGTASNSLIRSTNNVGNVMSINAKKAFSLSSAIGKVYQTYYWVIRAGDKLWDSIESSMDYVETLNYFDAALGQVAELAVSWWEEAGYDSADSYYNSFSSRAKELTSKMTGFAVNDDGTLTASGEASLGINPTKLMNYQATFAQMSSSMGVTSETSLLLSQALTEIGADLASVKNMDFDKVWTDMASGLAGMSRTLDKYGVNIRNVNLQQKLFELGINENITNLNQNDKALLRTIILLDSTKYAYIVQYAVELSMYTGMRVGELSGLKWEDIDLVKKTLTICRSEKYNRKTKEYYISTTKNDKVRVIPLTSEMEDVLARVKKAEMTNGFLGEFVFCNEYGRVHARTISDCVRNKTMSKEFEHTKSIHAIRRTLNSNLRCNGVSVTVAASILGHTEKVNEENYTYDVSNMDYKTSIISELNRKIAQG